MSEEPRPIVVKRGRAELTLEQIAAALPTAEDSMFVVGQEWGVCVHAARGGNWGLALFAAKHVRKLLATFALLNPQHAARIEVFRPILEAVIKAAERKDRPAFEEAFALATDRANVDHVETGHGFILWRVPPEKPTHLEMGPVEDRRPPR